MNKIDFKKENRSLYAPTAKEVSLVVVPPMRFLMVDGAGDPNSSPSFQEAMNVLFSVSYTAKFALKKGPAGIDYAVMPLEGLWWADDMEDFLTGNKAKWKWTVMIAQPDVLDETTLRDSIAKVRDDKGIAGTERLRIETFDEGRSAQILHIGPFTTEGPTVKLLHDYISANWHSCRGRHHEIYLSDFRRTAPERLKTVIRQPVT
jgi:hypothetical protein